MLEPGGSRPQVVVLTLHEGPPGRVVRPLPRLRRLRNGEEEDRVLPAALVHLAVFGQPLQTELAHRLQHPVARLHPRSILTPNEALIHEGSETFQDGCGGVGESRSRGGWRVVCVSPPRHLDFPTHGLRPFQGEAADKDGEPAKQGLLLCGEQIVAPGDGIAHRPLPGRRVQSATGQQRQPLLQPGEQRTWREDLDPGGGQLDGQRQTVQAAADVDHRLGILLGQIETGPGGLRPLNEEPHGLKPHRVRRDRDAGLIG